MDLRKALLNKQLIPVLTHQNDTYSLVETEGQRAATGLLSRQSASVQVAVVHSTHPNGYSFRAGDGYVIALTDSLLRVLEEAVVGYLAATSTREFIKNGLGIDYRPIPASPRPMTYGAAPASQRSRIASDPSIALFYEIMDSAWFFAVLHEAAHINQGDADHGRRNRGTHHKGQTDVPDLNDRLGQTMDLISYGGSGENARFRLAEFEADRQAACWLMQILERKYFGHGPYADPFSEIHIVLGAFGSMASILQIAHHEPDKASGMPLQDHPSFESRLVGFREGVEVVLLDPEGPLESVTGYQILHAVALLRDAIETVTLGSPSGFQTRL